MAIEKRKLKCNVCQNYTFHKLIHCYKQDLSEEHFYCERRYSLFECCGCQDVKMERAEYSEYCEYDDNGIIPDISIYPPYTLRQKPSWVSKLVFPFNADTGPVNRELMELISEIYVSLQNGCNRLTVMGIRALIEHVMIQKVGDKGRFVKNMDEFESQGYISKVQRTALDQVLEAGHAAIHRSYNPKQKEVIAAMDIVENIVESIYVVEKNQHSLKHVPKKK
ncbi:DUF4145 domain-containing protein [Vibrio cholerae]|uniref:DUF4145 domain-containing protein n=1 Tax=Vibrio cholerae TaxID=666 RepID=UPI0035315307